MRPSAKHMLLVSTLIPAFLLIGCDSAVTGLDRGGGPGMENEGEDVSGQSVAAEAPQDELCYQYRGEWVCQNEKDRRFPR